MTETSGFGTRCIHAGEAPDPTTGAHGVPLYQNVTFAFETYGQVAGMRTGERPHFTYSPRGNPTVRCLEVKLADLEGAESAIALNSGMAAISTALLSIAADGGHIVASDQLYDLSHTFLANELPAFGAAATFVDLSDPAAVARAIRPNTRAIFAEPFSNPLLRVTDPRPLAEIARKHDLLLVMDNTFLSPALFRPIEQGVDLVIHSATKYLSGHGQVQGGVIAGPRRLLDPMRTRALHLGNAMPPFAAWLLLSGTHTLPLRIARHSETALRLARRLERHPAVDVVHYPGLGSHKGHEIARALVGSGDDRFGGMLAFTLRGGEDAVPAVIDALELCTIAVSLGDCSTLAWPWHTGGLIRMSVGLEDYADLERDLLRALETLSPAAAAD